MRIFVTGREGQVARSLAERSAGIADVDLQFAARPAVDLSVPGSAAAAIRDARPDLVISAAAYTAVEPIAPLGTYGRTKADGEAAVRAGQGDHLILRTAWVYSPFGANFVKTMLRLSRERDEIAVVADQIGSPTNALDLADVILALASRRLRGDTAGWGQTYHAAGNGQASWAEFAGEIMRASGSTTRIRPIATADFPTPAQRPSWSVLAGSKLHSSFGLALPDWRSSLPSVVQRLAAEAAV
jgi:dTDP-4-dehydrorhamnose reductase